MRCYGTRIYVSASVHQDALIIRRNHFRKQNEAQVRGGQEMVSENQATEMSINCIQKYQS